MALPVHALYCFEVLNASLRHEKALSLGQVEDYYEQYMSCRGDAVAHVTVGRDTVSGLDENTSDAKVEKSHGDEAPVFHSSAHLSPQLDHQNGSSPASTPGSSTPASFKSAASSSSTVSTTSSRTSLSSRLSSTRSPQEQFPAHPMFITWNIYDRHGNKNLRGCIGTFEAQPLDAGLRSYALTSAFEDTRFAPIPASELPHLDCGVTLLTDFEPAPSPMAWDIGKHGLRISFTHHGKRYGSTYLPDVAAEQGWTKNETLVNLMRKAGWNGRRNEWMDVQDLRVIRYQGLKVQLRYEEWREWRDWVGEHSAAIR